MVHSTQMIKQHICCEFSVERRKRQAKLSGGKFGRRKPYPGATQTGHLDTSGLCHDNGGLTKRVAYLTEIGRSRGGEDQRLDLRAKRSAVMAAALATSMAFTSWPAPQESL